MVRSLTPYVPGEQPRGTDLTKLNTNESPYPPSPRVLEAIASITPDDLRLYPDPESVALRQAIAKRYGLDLDQVFVGNGSDEVIALAFMALLNHDLPLCFPDVSYSFYPVWADLYGIQYQTIPVATDFSIEPDAYPERNGGIIIPNPNAPTGMVMDIATIRVLLERCKDSVVVIDEAYIDYGGESTARLIGEYDNLLVVQTLSKSRALAGLRVGWAMGAVGLLEALGRVKNSFNSYPLDVVAQRAALASLEDEGHFSRNCEKVIESREHLTGRLGELGFEVLPSGANFVLATHPEFRATELFARLRERGIIVRYFDKPRIEDFLRITIGSPQQVAALLAALEELVSS